MSAFEWHAQVRVSGVRDGWHCNTIVDTPWFTLHDNSVNGNVARVARDMFVGALKLGDDIYVAVRPADETQPVAFWTFGVGDRAVTR